MTQGKTGGPGDSAAAADAKEKANRSKGRAQDYNSSRSNNINGATDAGPGDNGRVVRKKPGT